MSGWREQDWLFEAAGTDRALTHAMLPTPILLEDRIRVYFASCDKDLRGRIWRVDLELEAPWRVIERSRDPVMDVGGAGAFDCDGVNPSQVMWCGDRLRLYYIGWRRVSEDTPYTLFAACSESRDGGLSFPNASEPMLAPSATEPLFRTAPFVYRAGGGWSILYIGGGRFVSEGAKRLPIYGLRQAFSEDGLVWPKEGRLLLAPDEQAGELGFGRPVVWSEGGEAQLYLSMRSRTGYQLVRGRLQDAEAGLRRFERALNFEQAPWATGMTCFGAPCRVGRTELLFYNGDQFGRTGFGLAVRSSDF